MQTITCDFCGAAIKDERNQGDSKLIFSHHIKNAQLLELDLCSDCTERAKIFIDQNIKKA